MLQRTFLHLPGVGAHTERKIWARGIRRWDDFLSPASKHPWEHLRVDLERSRHLLETRQWSEFSALLPAAERWRAWPDLGAQAVFVDIETDGALHAAATTLIGCHGPDGYRAFVRGQNLDDAADYLAGFPLWITYSGAQFDVPLIRQLFPRAVFNHIHIDLRFPLRRLGFRGGLKQIEAAVGLARSETTRGCSGLDAVYWWRAWQAGDRRALQCLLAYNQEDVENLRPLMEMVCRDLSRDWI